MPHVGHDLDLSVSQTGLVLIDDGWFDDSVLSAMHDQDRLPEHRRQIVLSNEREKSACRMYGYSSLVAAARRQRRYPRISCTAESGRCNFHRNA